MVFEAFVKYKQIKRGARLEVLGPVKYTRSVQFLVLVDTRCYHDYEVETAPTNGPGRGRSW